MDVTMRNELATPALTKLTAGTPVGVEFSERDDKMVLVISSDEATKLTVKAGNGLQGVCDLTLDVPKGISLIKLESGRFKFVSGENKGKIVISSTGTPSVGIAALV